MGATKLVELLPGLWVRPDQVQSFCAVDGGLISIQLVGAAPRQFYNHKDTPLAELAAKLDGPQWEQPPNDGGTLTLSGPLPRRESQSCTPVPDDSERSGYPCSTCGMSYDECTQRILGKTKACCKKCYKTDTHHTGEGATL